MEGFISTGGRDYFLLTEVDTRSKRVHLRAWRFDPPTLTIAEEPLTLASVESLDPVLSTYTWAFSRNRDRLERPGIAGPWAKPGRDVCPEDLQSELDDPVRASVLASAVDRVSAGDRVHPRVRAPGGLGRGL